MSITRNRELSQFGSFIYVDNSNKEIGIATEATPYVGIGTANPAVKFDVVGDTNIHGDLTVTGGNVEAPSYTLNGTPLLNAQLEFFKFGPSANDIYRLQGNIGIGTSVLTQKLTVNGNVSAGQFISTVTSGTAPLVILSDTQVTNLNASFLRGKTPPSGSIVGTSDTQTLTNKTLTSPTINGGSFSSSGITLTGSASGTTNLQASAIASGTVTIPAATTTLVGRGTTDTLTNKTIAASSNTITGLTNSNLSGSAGITNSNLANSTISGISLGSNLNSLSFGSYLTSSGSYDGSAARTLSVSGTSANTANTLVARDVSGDFTAGTVTVTNLNASSTVSATSFVGNLSGNATTSSSTYGCTFAEDSRYLENITTRIDSGFYETASATIAEGWPINSNSYMHLLSCTHSNDASYYAMQFASDFNNNNSLYYRSTNNYGLRSWAKIWTSASMGSGSGLDADLLDGYHAATSGGNTIVLTNPDGRVNVQKDVHASGANACHLELFAPDSGSSGGEVSLRMHQGNRWFGQIRLRSDGFHFTQGDTNDYRSISVLDVNSTSDINLKTNIKKIDEPIEKLSQINGVSFDWKNTGKPSIGVIAQEVEKVFPELVKDGETKSMNYDGLIGVLVEAIKELSGEVEELKKKVS